MSTVARASDLRVEYLENPLGVGSDHPRLFWRLAAPTDDDTRRGIRQSAYQIIVASSRELLAEDSGDLWDSGRVESDVTTHVTYEGAPLAPLQTAYWKVRAWGADGEAGEWSEVASFEKCADEAAFGAARWIAADYFGGGRAPAPAPYFRREFTVGPSIARARLLITALGIWDCRINNKPVTTDVFRPGWTDYHKRVYFDTYDVTDLLESGENAIGVILGDGWYAGHIAGKDRQQYGEKAMLRTALRIEYADGSVETICTDDSWRYSTGGIIDSDLIMGESFDARQHPTGFAQPRFDDGRWMPARAESAPSIPIEPTPNEPVRPIMTLTPVGEPGKASHNWHGNKLIYDIGQNMVGRVRVTLRGERGATIRLRYAEMLDADGGLYTANLRSARATDYYTMAGEGPETYEPYFTFHGFRYVEILTQNSTVSVESLEGVVLHNDMREAGTFECSNQMLNQLQHNIQWGQRGNFLEVPTDCPQRDERLGWTGDAQVFARTAAFNMNVAGFFTKWFQDFRDDQNPDGGIPPVIPSIGLMRHGGPAWADAAVICPWTMYLCYGDKDVIRNNMHLMKTFLNYVRDNLTKDDINGHPEAFPWGGFGDWLALDDSGRTQGRTPKDLIGTAFYAYSCGLVSKMANVLGDSDTQREFADRRETARRAYRRRFVTEDGLVVEGTQTAYILSLYFDMVEERHRKPMLDALVADIERRGDHLATGFVGTPYLMHVLTENGRHDVAERLIFQDTVPSWLYPITQGATTMWERWNSYTHDQGFGDVGMNSFNHYAYGAVGEWLYRKVAGLDVDPNAPGYRRIIVRPWPLSGLEYAAASTETLYGTASSGWKRDGRTMAVTVTIPPNCAASVVLPTTAPVQEVASGAAMSAEDAPGVKRIEGDPESTAFEVVSGTYQFTFEPGEKDPR